MVGLDLQINYARLISSLHSSFFSQWSVWLLPDSLLKWLLPYLNSLIQDSFPPCSESTDGVHLFDFASDLFQIIFGPAGFMESKTSNTFIGAGDKTI